MNHGPTFSFSMLIFVLTCIGFLDGCLAAALFRRKRWYLWGAAGAALTFASEEAYSWYRLAYADTGVWGTAAGYGACAVLVAAVAAALPLAVLSVLSVSRTCRVTAQRLGAGWLCLSLLAGLYGVSLGNHPEETEKIAVTADALPAAFEGYRVAQISDTHIGPYYHPADLEAALDAAESSGADLTVVIGDLIDDMRYMPEAARILEEKKGDFPDGILFIWGNHEYYRGRETVRRHLEEAGIPILENESVKIRRGGDVLFAAGVDYPWTKGAGHAAEMRAMADQAFADIPAGAAVLFLAHHSDFIDEGFARGAALTLTGHTHAMQFGIAGRPVVSHFKYTRGMYEGGDSLGYVSRGNGGWFPFRLGCGRELAVFELHGK